MSYQAPETSDLVDALRAALSGQAMPVHVGQLRLRLEGALGPERTRAMRREVHQVMAAAEEHLPSRLTQVRPLTVATLARVASELAVARSWSPPTAERTTRIWAAALGFENLAQAEWPAHQASQRPSASIDSLGIGRTAPPPGPAAVESRVAWPTPPKAQLKRHPTSSIGEEPLGIAPTYAGMPLPVYLGSLAGLTALLIVVLFLAPPIVGIFLPVVGFGVGTVLTRAAGQGTLVATSEGIEYTPNTGLTGRPAAEPTGKAPWRNVEVEVGTFSSITFSGKSHQLSPRGRAFAEAAASAAGSS